MKRKFLISTLGFLIFISVCIYALARAQGNQLGSDGNLTNTSILRVNSTPSDVTVYINDQKALRNENRIEWLVPGSTKVTLKKAGYIDWEKTVELKAGVIEDIYAQLYPERLDFDKISDVNVDNFFFANNSDYIFYSVVNGEKDTDNGLWRLKLKRNILDIGNLVPSKVYTFTTTELVKLRANLYDFKISDDSSKAILDIPSVKEIYYIDLNNPNPTSIKDILSFYPTKSNWLRNSNSMVASNGTILVTLDLNSKDLNLVYYSPDKEILFSTSSNQIYYFRSDKNVIYNLNGSQSNPVVLPASYAASEVISNIYTSRDNSDIFYTLENSNLNFIDLEKNLSIQFMDIKEVLAVSPSGREVLYLGSDDLLKTIVLKDAQDLKTYTYTINSLNLTRSTLSNVFYTPSGKNIVALVNDPATLQKHIQFMDSDGKNSANLIENQNMVGVKIGIDDSGLGLYVMLKDPSDAVQDATVNNIYKYDLVAQ